MARAALFRDEWVDRHRAGVRAGGLVRHARWTGRAALALGAAVIAGGAWLSTLWITTTTRLPAHAQGATATALLPGGESPPPIGTAVSFAPDRGPAVRGTVSGIERTVLSAHLDAAPGVEDGSIVMRSDRRRLVTSLLPRLNPGRSGP